MLVVAQTADLVFDIVYRFLLNIVPSLAPMNAAARGDTCEIQDLRKIR